jgi:hypothetical protein
MKTQAAPRIVGAADGKSGILGAIGVRFMAAGEDTDRRFSLVEHPMPPRALAAPLHRHSREDEYSFVLEGTMRATGRGDRLRRRWRPRLQAPRPMAHVLERRRRAVPDPRAHLPLGVRALFRGGGRHDWSQNARVDRPDRQSLRVGDEIRDDPSTRRPARAPVARDEIERRVTGPATTTIQSTAARHVTRLHRGRDLTAEPKMHPVRARVAEPVAQHRLSGAPAS